MYNFCKTVIQILKLQQIPIEHISCDGKLCLTNNMSFNKFYITFISSMMCLHILMCDKFCKCFEIGLKHLQNLWNLGPGIPGCISNIIGLWGMAYKTLNRYGDFFVMKIILPKSRDICISIYMDAFFWFLVHIWTQFTQFMGYTHTPTTFECSRQVRILPWPMFFHTRRLIFFMFFYDDTTLHWPSKSYVH